MTNNDELVDEINEDLKNNEIPSSDDQQNNIEGAPAASKKRSKAEVVINVALWIAIVLLLIAVAMRLFVFSTVEVDGASMNPTYESHEIVTVNKVTLPKRGDVVVFYKNEVDNRFTAQFAKREECAEGQPYEKLIKRVVAVAGDKIWVQQIAESGNDIMYEVVIDTADGDRLIEDYYVKKGETLRREVYYIHTVAATSLGLLENYTEANPFVVSEGCFFAMGDNRSNSMDSRKFGEFKLTQLFGVVLDK